MPHPNCEVILWIKYIIHCYKTYEFLLNLKTANLKLSFICKDFLLNLEGYK